VPLPPQFTAWFASRGWQLRPHQLALLEAGRLRQSTLLIAPTGAGKTLAGFLPSLVDLTQRKKSENQGAGLHTVYISPLKALAVDVARNLTIPVAEMKLRVSIETRTSDTPSAKRQRQRVKPPDILLTTPEQIALLLSHEEAPYLFADLKTIILDELHSLVASKRGDLMALGLARLRTLAPDMITIGLSATVKRPSQLRAYLVAQNVKSECKVTRSEGADHLIQPHDLTRSRNTTSARAGRMSGVFTSAVGENLTSPADVKIPDNRIEQSSKRFPGTRVDGIAETPHVHDGATAASAQTMTRLGALVITSGGAKPDISILESDQPLPWAGHTSRYAVPMILDAVRAHKLTLLFVNTRSQAEILFQELWKINDDTLPIALHHGSLAAPQRRKVEAAMAAGSLRAVVATSTLDLGIDWGDVDLVINVGAPKGASRLIQRIGRANHRLDEPSKAILVPANRFEVLECRAALEAAEAGEQDAELTRAGAIDVLAQHVLGVACSGPFLPDQLFAEVRAAAPYAHIDRITFDRVVDFASTGGYALRAYERFAKLRPTDDGRLRLAHPRLAQQHRLNIGTIVDSEMLKVRLVRRGAAPKPGVQRSGKPLTGGRHLGEIDEYFVSEMTPGDTFIFAGEIVRLEGVRDSEAYVSKGYSGDPKVPSYPGGKFPLSTHLASRVRGMLADASSWGHLPAPVSDWLQLQSEHSHVPGVGEVLVETFPRQSKHFLVAYPFEGRLAHQTLGMLLTRRLERARARPLGFVANDYGLSIWTAADLSAMLDDGRLNLNDLFDQDMLGDDLDAWLAESSLMKRTFRSCAVIAGLIERRHPGKEKSGRQVTFSTNLIYDVLRQHDPGHILLEAAWADAATGLLDISRLGEFLARIRGKITHRSLDRASPLSVPILLEIGREPVVGVDRDALLRDAAEALIAEATQG
jgi:ATP-dependent helicase Lhr and Lhr-like helicase